ncbi:MAG: hypothetical protein RSF86_14560 [Angelakisella sp.]
MRRLKQWLYDKFLPAWCRDDLISDNRAAQDKIKKLEQENKELQAYIDGIHAALRNQRRITIRNEVKP